MLRRVQGVQQQRTVTRNVIQAGADVNGHTKCVEILIQTAVDVNHGPVRNTVLIKAAENRHQKSIEMLTEAGVDVNFNYRDGFFLRERNILYSGRTHKSGQHWNLGSLHFFGG